MDEKLHAEQVKVQEMVARVRAAGLNDEADVFERSYWGMIRTASAYRHALPYVDKPESGYTASGTLHVTTYTIQHWAPMIPGCPVPDNEAVLKEDRADDVWHQEEDRRMRRAAGEEL